MNNYLISVVICSHNRDKYLETSLASLQNQSIPQHAYEIIVVDNNSTDQTRAVVSRLQSENSHLRYYFESQLGLSYARNTGWHEATSDIIA